MKDSLNKFLIFIICVLVIVVIFLSGERQAFYSTVIFLILSISIIDQKNIYYFSSVYFFSISLILIFLIFNSNINKRMLNPIINMKNLVINLVVKDTKSPISNLDNKSSKDLSNIVVFSTQHTSHYKVAIAMFKDNIFFGKGPNSFRKLCSKKKYTIYVSENQSGCAPHPHNFYLQNLAETGIVGFLAIFSFFIYIFIKFLIIIYNRLSNPSTNHTLSNSQTIMYIHIIILLNPLMPNGNFFNNYLNITYFYILSLNFMIINNPKLLSKLVGKKIKLF